MKRVFSLILSLYFCSVLSAQETGVYATIDTSQILIGDQVDFTITCIQNEEYKLQFPQHTDTIITGIEIIEAFENDTIEEGKGQLTIERKYTITSFDTGAYMLPVGPFILKQDTIYGKSLFLSVNTMQVDTAKSSIKPIKLPYKQPYTLEELLPWIIGAIILLLLIGLGIYIYFYRKKHKDNAPKIVIPKDPPHIIAYRELDELKLDQLWQKEKYKEYYSLLTETLRRYLEGKFKIQALEQTSDEIIATIEAKSLLKSSELMTLKEIFSISDLAKFAKYIPDPDENTKQLEQAYIFIDRTKTIEQNPIAEQQETNAKDIV